MTAIPAGKHLFHYDIHWQLKYFMEAEIKPGKNFLKPDFTESFLPSLSRRLDYAPTAPAVEGQQEFKYLLYDKQNRRLENQALIKLAVRGQPDPKNKDLMTFTYDWQVVENGKIVSQKQEQKQNLRSNEESRSETVVIAEDPLHYWYRKIFISRDASELEVGAAYIEYLHK